MSRQITELEDMYTRAIYDGLSPNKFAKNMIEFFKIQYEPMEDEIVDLKDQCKRIQDKNNIYLDILSTLEESLNVFFKEEEENKRFNFPNEIDYRECIVNLKKSLDEYKLANKIRF
jgi:hypothetical protein